LSVGSLDMWNEGETGKQERVVLNRAKDGPWKGSSTVIHILRRTKKSKMERWPLVGGTMPGNIEANSTWSRRGGDKELRLKRIGIKGVGRGKGAKRGPKGKVRDL